MVGRERNEEILYLVDYGMSKFYRDDSGNHKDFSRKRSFIGTSRYASIAAHIGDELSRKDDLESLGYILIYLVTGRIN